MGLLNKLLATGGLVLVSAVASDFFKDAREEKRRRTSPVCFDPLLPETEFIEIAREIGRRTARVKDVTVTGMTITLDVGSITGLSSWNATIDFSDYGRLTGKYWVSTENTESRIPEHYAQEVKARIEQRVQAASTW